jgi:hypothetical protein
MNIIMERMGESGMTEGDKKAILSFAVIVLKIPYTLPNEQREQQKDEAKEALLRKINKNTDGMPEYILQSLKDAIKNQDGVAVELALFLGSYFIDFCEIESKSKFSNDLISILRELMEEDWHYSHEWLVSTFQTVEILYRTALRKFDYLAYDDAYALAVKCIWALGDIDTPESMDKIRLLLSSDNPIIKKNAIEQLRLHNARKRKNAKRND